MEINKSMISLDMIDKLNVKDEKFLVVSYDLPSEFFKSKDTAEFTKIKSILLRKRMNIGHKFYQFGVRLNNSVYVIDKNKIGEIIKKIEEEYFDVPKKYSDNVNVKVVGTVFKPILESLLIEDIENLISKIKEFLEIINADIDFLPNYKKQEPLERRKQTLIKRLYKISYFEDIIENRTEDLEQINTIKSNDYKNQLTKLIEVRKGIMRRL